MCWRSSGVERDDGVVIQRVAFVALFALTGCTAAPSLTVAGAFFPAWLACALLGVLGAVAARAAMVATGLATAVPFQLLVCTAIGIIVASLFWVIWIT